LDRLEKKFSKAEVDKTLHTFINEFPPIEVYLKKVDIDSYLNGITEGVSNREIVLEEMLLLWLANNNPAFSRYDELFDDESLEHETIYLPLLEELNEFFDDQPHLDLGYGALNLIRLLRSPSESSPDSLKDQLLYIKEKWGAYLKANLKTMWELFLSESFMELWGDLSTDYEMRLLRTLDFITEEQKMRFNPALGAAPTHALEFGGADAEPERFSPDVHWMPSLVLLAKSTLVWLDQLSKKYQRHIYRLDQIPDEELDTLARWGFSGLWLIGIWQRSHASKEIKRRCGNPEAESSAYSLFDYRVANELGGHSAYENLRDRCWQRGIRLASDMVPNHTGIDSKWIREHPDWFIQLPYSPFPS
ncbi:MAG: alpha-amylase, partial [Aliifodinibius sp.]|nr:alpha-amylase [Fodinibius sp.]